MAHASEQSDMNSDPSNHAPQRLEGVGKPGEEFTEGKGLVCRSAAYDA